MQNCCGIERDCTKLRRLCPKFSGLFYHSRANNKRKHFQAPKMTKKIVKERKVGEIKHMAKNLLVIRYGKSVMTMNVAIFLRKMVKITKFLNFI